MADWTHQPVYAYVVEVDSPPTLITEYEDGKEHRREKHTNFPRRFIEEHDVSSTDADAMIDFYKTKGLLTSFSKVSYDPSEAAAVEVTVRFVRAVTFTQDGPAHHRATIEFKEVF